MSSVGKNMFEGAVKERKGALGVRSEVGGGSVRREGKVFEEGKQGCQGFGKRVGEGTQTVSETSDRFCEGRRCLQIEGKGCRG